MNTARKTEAVNLRMASVVKELLRLAADREHRTLSNMLEVLVLLHCEQHGTVLPIGRARRKTVPKAKSRPAGHTKRVRRPWWAAINRL